MSEAGDGAADGDVHEVRGLDRIVGAAEPAPPTDGRARRIRQPRLPTPYPPPQSPIPGPSTSPFASRLGPAPIGSPYAGRATGAAMPAIQVPPPSGKATTESGPGFFSKQVPMVGVWLLCFGFLVARLRHARAFGGKSTPRADDGRREAAAAAPAPAVGRRTRAERTARRESGAEARRHDGDREARDTAGHGGAGRHDGAAGRQSGSRTVASDEEADRDGEAAQAAGRHGRRRRRRRQPKPAIAKEPKPPATPAAPKPTVAKEPEASGYRHGQARQEAGQGLGRSVRKLVACRAMA